jgi:hypothetical protein
VERVGCVGRSATSHLLHTAWVLKDALATETLEATARQNHRYTRQPPSHPSPHSISKDASCMHHCTAVSGDQCGLRTMQGVLRVQPQRLESPQ